MTAEVMIICLLGIVGADWLVSGLTVCPVMIQTWLSAIPRYYRDHTSGASFHAVMDIMGLLRANRSPYLYPRYLAPAKNCLKQSHTSRLIQNVHPAHTPVTVWDYKIIHPSNIKCTLHSSLLPVREEHMRYKGESRADNALQWLNQIVICVFW